VLPPDEPLPEPPEADEPPLPEPLPPLFELPPDPVELDPPVALLPPLLDDPPVPELSVFVSAGEQAAAPTRSDREKTFTAKE
jgi:hypothetical protein